MKIAIIGGGHSAHVLIACLGGKHEVRLLTSKVNQWRNNCTIKCRFTGIDEVREGTLQLATTQPEVAVKDCDMVVLCLPVYLYITKLKEIAPHLGPNVVIGSLYGQDYFPHSVRRARINTNTVTLFAFCNIPWVCRTERYGHSVTATMKHTCPCAISGPQAKSVLHQLRSEFMVIPDVLPNFLLPTLIADNSILHPANLFTHFNAWPDKLKNFQEIPYFYRDVTPEGYQLLENLDKEVMAIVNTLDKKYPELKAGKFRPSSREQVFNMYPNLNLANAMSTVEVLETFFRNEAILRDIKSPMLEISSGHYVPDLDHRMFKDDIAHGLCNYFQLASWLGIAAPTCTRLIQWFEKLLDKQYIVNGQLSGRDQQECDLYGTSLNSVVTECQQTAMILSNL